MGVETPTIKTPRVYTPKKMLKKNKMIIAIIKKKQQTPRVYIYVLDT